MFGSEIKPHFKQLGKDSIIYGLGGALAGSINFFLMPVYTRIFTPTEYGIMTLLVVVGNFLKTLLEMGMDAAQSFYFFEQKKSGKVSQRRVISSILQWKFIWGISVIGIALCISPLLNAQFFNGQLTWIYFACAFIGCFFESIANQSAQLFRLLYRPWGFISINFGIALSSAAMALMLIIIFNWGMLGFFVGMVAGTLCMAVTGWWANRGYLDWSKWHKDWWPRLLRFGTPLVPAGLAMYVLNTSDRWFISHYRGQDELGLYAVGANFAMIIALLVVTFRRAWWPIAMDAIHSSDGPVLFRTMARLYVGLGSAGIVLLTACSPLLVRWFSGPKFHSAYPIVGILAWHSLFYGFYLIAAAGIWKKERTLWLPILTGIAALLNIALDAWLVPQYGGMGAAIATSLSFLIWDIMALIISERLWPVQYPWFVFALQVSIGMLGCTGILSLYIFNQGLWKVITLTTVVLIILTGLTVKKEYFHTQIRT